MRTVRVRALIEHDGQYLFVTHSSRSLSSGTWVLPGGHLEAGETIEDGIRREVVEELGIKPVLGKIKYIHQLFIDYQESLEFFIEVLNGSAYVGLDLKQASHAADEITEARFIDPSKETILPAFLANITEHEQAGDWPKFYFARYPEL